LQPNPHRQGQPTATWPHSGLKPGQQWLLPPMARARAARNADVWSVSTTASAVWSVARTWHNDGYAVFTDGFTVKWCTRRAWSRGPSHTNEARRSGGQNPPARDDVSTTRPTVGSTAASVAPIQPVGDQDKAAISKRERGELGVATHQKGAIGGGLALA
jgi:hypothetical protein